jgi:hypothetical protein
VERKKNFGRERAKSEGKLGEKGRNRVIWEMWAHKSRVGTVYFRGVTITCVPKFFFEALVIVAILRLINNY